MAPTTATSAATTAAKPISTANHAPGTRTENPAGRGAYLTDDEILGLVSGAMARDTEQARGRDAEATRNSRHRKSAGGANAAGGTNGANLGEGETDANAASDVSGASGEDVAGDPRRLTAAEGSVPENLRAAMRENPELRQAWQDAQDYREIFATPQAAREATAMLGDLNRLDALFFSRRPEDHAELAKSVAQLDPAAFASLARAMAAVAAQNNADGASSGAASTLAAPQNPAANASPAADNCVSREAAAKPAANETAQTSHANDAPAGFTPAQAEFFQAANASAVEGVMEAIESQLDRLLPENMPARARTRVAGEVYRELDAALRGNREFSEQVRRAFRSGALDAGHERAIVSLVTRQARQALPGVAKRVLNEWTSALVTANAERRERQRTAERRVDIAGTGGGRETRRSASPRDIDYARMSDADILNL